MEQLLTGIHYGSPDGILPAGCLSGGMQINTQMKIALRVEITAGTGNIHTGIRAEQTLKLESIIKDFFIPILNDCT